MQELISLHVGFLQLLISLVQVKFQNRKESPFETHISNMIICITALFFYGVFVAMKMKTTQYNNNDEIFSKILDRLIPILGIISSVSLASVFMPWRFSWVGFVICAILSAMVVRDLLHQFFHWLYKKIVNLIILMINKLKSYIKGEGGGPTQNQQPSRV